MTNPIKKQDELANFQGLVERLDVGSDKVFTSLEALTLSFILPTKDFFIKFMKAFVESIQD